jgi:acyl-CoA synthetase (AMP-forming)/AMP-acid ligase II/acyl carrier protein
MTCCDECIVDRLFQYASQFPDVTAFRILGSEGGNETPIAYARLAARVQGLAAVLGEGRWRGARVLLVYEDVAEFIVAFLACQYAGIIPVPVPYANGSRYWRRLLFILEDAQARTVFCTCDTVSRLQEAVKEVLPAGEIIFFTTDDTEAKDQLPVYHRKTGEEIALLQYSSGSTGDPKGIIISSTNLMHNQRLIAHSFGCNRDSVIFSWLPFHHDMGLIGNILHTVYTGCTGILMSPLHFMQRPQRWFQAISRYRVTHSGGPNFAYDLCVEKWPADQVKQLDLSCWKVAYNGSEPIRHETLQRFARHFKPAGFSPESWHPCYGLAEATLLVAGQRSTAVPLTVFADRESAADGKVRLKDEADPSSRAIVASGLPAPEMEVRIINELQPKGCPELVEGEIGISGNSVSPGYWNNDNPGLYYNDGDRKFLRTGDVGFFYRGLLFVSGRIKEMLISRGRNIYPYDIEQRIAEKAPELEPSGIAVFCSDPSREEIVLVAEIKRSWLSAVDHDSLIRTIDRLVTGTFGIDLRDILLIAASGIPRTTSGKLQRVKCREMFRTGAFTSIAAKSRLSAEVAPAGEEGGPAGGDKSALTAVLQDVNPVTVSNYLRNLITWKLGRLDQDLQLDKTGLPEIGIDSIKATELINRMNKELDIHVELSALLQDQTFTGLVTTVENLLWLKNAQPLGQEITI